MNRVSTKSLSLGVFLALTVGCVGVERDQAAQGLSQGIEDAKACGPSSQCIVFGRGNCSCPYPINAEAQPRVEALVNELNKTCEPEDFLGDCVTYENPRCEEGQCVADVRTGQ